MDFRPTPEQTLLRDEVRELLAALLPHERLESALTSPAGWAEEAWAELAGLGLVGLLVPEAAGGAGLGLVEAVLVLEETGAALLPAPFLAGAVLAAPLLSAQPGLAREAAQGGRTWAVALDGDVVAAAAEPEAGSLPRQAPLAGGCAQLHGRARLVADALSAEGLVVAARSEAGCGLWALLTGGRRTPLETIDATRRLATVDLAGELAVELAAPGSPAAAAIAATQVRLRLGLAAEAVGVARRALELGVEHARVRTQFGRPIGAYQAVAHPLADTYADVELARSLVWRAAWAADNGSAGAAVEAAAAKALAAEAAVAACERSIQVHGAIGFTWELPLQRLLKRAQGISASGGGGDALRAEVAAALLDGR